MNWTEFSRQIGKLNAAASSAELFRFWVCLVQDRIYRWGGESISGTDCSGTIALGLFGAGYNVRMTANDYYRLLFTDSCAGFDAGDIAAVFYLANTRRKHGDRMVDPGYVTHVTPIIGEEAVLDAATAIGGVLLPARIKSLAAAEATHRKFNVTPVYAALNWPRLEALHLSGRYPVDDKELLALVA